MNTSRTGIRAWRVNSGIEPVVRIGVVLAEDAMRALQMRLPAEGYELAAAGQAPRALESADVSARLDGEQVAVAVDGQQFRSAASWRITPLHVRMPQRCEGTLVKGVVAGRGFHWQKNVDQTLAGTLELLPSPAGLVLVNELPLESYLAGVITSEMSSQCPIEFLRAQCITARSWLLAFTEPKHESQPFDRCNDDCCQRYQGTGDLSEMAIEATQSTRGLVLMAPNGGVVDANYSKSCGGIVELPEHVWGVHKPGLAPQVDAPPGSAAHRFIPVTEQNLAEYLDGPWLNDAGIYCSPAVIPADQLGKYLGRVDETGEYFRWSVSYEHDELVDILRTKEPRLQQMRRLRDLRVTARGISGRATSMIIDYETGDGEPTELVVPDQYEIRRLLHRSFLFSSAFDVRIERDGDGHCRRVTLRGAGWGHGAGLCQIGALGMSLVGLDHATIVKHYFPDSQLRRLYA